MDEREIEAVAEALNEYLRGSGDWSKATPAMAKVAIGALDRVRDARGDDESGPNETSDAVRERPIRHLPVNGPDDRQPNAPDRGQLRDAAIPASGRGRSSAIDTARKVAQFAYEQGVGDAVAVDDLIAEIEWLTAELEQARINAACVGEMADEAEAEVKRLTAIVDAQAKAD